MGLVAGEDVTYQLALVGYVHPAAPVVVFSDHSVAPRGPIPGPATLIFASPL